MVLDDRLLIEELLVGLPPHRPVALHTTSYWYYRACRAAVLGSRGHLSGPFAELDVAEQESAIVSLLELRSDIALPDPRTTVPAMVRVAGRNPRLNLMNLEAVATGEQLHAVLWLSPETAAGVLPSVLDHHGVAWDVITIG